MKKLKKWICNLFKKDKLSYIDRLRIVEALFFLDKHNKRNLDKSIGFCYLFTGSIPKIVYVESIKNRYFSLNLYGGYWFPHGYLGNVTRANILRNILKENK